MNTASSAVPRPPQDYAVYATNTYPQTFGELLDWSLAWLADPEHKNYLRIVGQPPVTNAAFARNVTRICNVLRALGLKKCALDPAEFFGFCNREMPYFMVPRFLLLHKNPPKTATLLVEKYRLQQDGLANAVDRKQFSLEL